jgi:nickel-dependent lactate racemase
MQVEIGWGAQARVIEVPEGSAVLRPPAGRPACDLQAALGAALLAPVGSAPLSARLAGVRRVCVLVPDNTRKGVAQAVLPALAAVLDAAGVSWSVGVATGKHPPTPHAGAHWVHDAADPALVPVGVTARGTEVRYPQAVIEADLRILVGEIRPHYFAGWAGGAKAVFPGVAGAAGIWHNHRLKALPGARLGVVEGNPCRADMEAAAALAGPSFLINLVRGRAGVVAVVAGDVVAAHRAGVALARPLFEVGASRRFAQILVSDGHPVTASLYQACKLLPPAGALLEEGGTVIIAADLASGVGPVQVINEAIYGLGVRHALPASHRVVLVSSRTQAEVEPTFCTFAASLEGALGGRPTLVLPRGGDIVPVLT